MVEIYRDSELACFIKAEGEIQRSDGNLFSVAQGDQSGFELHFEGRGRLVWPNREGEGFDIGGARAVLRDRGCLESGIAISWPATASAEAVMAETSGGSGFIFQADRQTAGLHRELRIFSDAPGSLRLRFTGAPVPWRLTGIKGLSAAPKGTQPAGYQFQVGLIGPDGESEAEGGFSVLADLAEHYRRILDITGADAAVRPVVHLFGYAAGHDRGYPDYRPAESLGGPSALASAADCLHRHGFILSCYLNARIAEEETLKRYPQLQAGVCRKSDGQAVIEEYRGRRFNVMDPSSGPWLDHLYEQAVMLSGCGADAVQLDQVSGRSPVSPPGASWGAGYRRLIERLQSAGLKVWIQGVSDYYPADWFEMAYRDLSILPGGILRGGNPFGDTDLSLLAALKQSRPSIRGASYLVPLHKARRIDSCGLPLIIDVMTVGELLPLYGRDYLKMLEELELTGPCF